MRIRLDSETGLADFGTLQLVASDVTGLITLMLQPLDTLEQRQHLYISGRDR